MKRIAMYVVISLMAVSVVFSNGGGESDAGTPVKTPVDAPVTFPASWSRT